jgi:hypothetical protein
VKRIAIVVLLLISVLVFVSAAAPALTQSTCPDDDGWTKVEDSNFHSVDGADQYCGKGGSSETQGCVSYYIEGSYGDVSAAIAAGGACGLSHWAYHISEQEQPSETPDPSPTFTPTNSVTPDPDATPTFTATVTNTPDPDVTPTSTQTPNQLTETPSIEVTCPVPSGGQTCRKGSG